MVKPDLYGGIRPSALPRFEPCIGSLAMEYGIEREASAFAAEGTAAHLVCSESLIQRVDCFEFVGKTYSIDGFEITVTEEMAEDCQVYVDAIRMKSKGRVLMVEKDVDLSGVFGIEGRKGQIDALIASANVLEIDDLKFGMGVKVEHTPQLEAYALAALDELSDLLDEITEVHMTIHQPRLNHIYTWTLSVAELEVRRGQIKDAALKAKECLDKHDLEFTTRYLVPGEKQCKFCAAKAKCPALAGYVESAIINDLDDATVDNLSQAAEQSAKALTEVDANKLSEYLKAVPLIQMWCDAVQARANVELTSGNEVPGFKLVEGRAGARKWADEEAATQAFKAMRLKDDVIFKQSLISPTQAEKLVKTGELGPRQWTKLQDLISRSAPKPTVVPESDKRPALSIQPIENDLDDLVATSQEG